MNLKGFFKGRFSGKFNSLDAHQDAFEIYINIALSQSDDGSTLIQSRKCHGRISLFRQKRSRRKNIFLIEIKNWRKDYQNLI